MDTLNLGNVIKLKRVEQNLKQAELAARAGLSQGYISAIERGARDNITMETAWKIASALGIKLALLCEESFSEKPTA